MGLGNQRRAGVWSLLEAVLTVTVMIIILISIAGYLVDRPVFVSYARSGSMEPTIGRGDLFFINPLSKGAQGDIIVFRSKDEWTVHRIYAVTDRGYITKGDANVATDQSNGGAYVRREDVAGTVITLGGRVLKIPGAGDYLSKALPHSIPVLMGMIFVGGLISFWSGGRDRKKRGRSRRTVRIPLKPFYWSASAVIILLFIMAILSTWGTASFSYSSTMAGGQREGWYLPRSRFNETMRVENRAFYTFYYVVEPESGDIAGVTPSTLRVGGRSAGEIAVMVSVPSERRIHVGRIMLRGYPALPFMSLSLLERLYSLSPYLPLLVYASTMLVFLLLVYLLLGLGDAIATVRIGRRSTAGRVLGLIGFWKWR